jgi:YidC/Oxa1 family membrane protein insertase
MLWLIPIGTLSSGLIFNFPLGVLLYWLTSNTWTLAQQFYIIKYHPPVEEPKKPVGELGKTLAPPPGKRPDRTRARQGAVQAIDAEETEAEAPAARTSTPRVGQKPPNRQAGKRPPAKRPTQAKKRR